MTDLIESQYVQSRKKAEEELWQQILREEQGEKVPGQVKPESERMAPKGKEIEKGTMGAGKDILTGIKEAPVQIGGGVLDAVDVAGQGIEAAGNYLRDKTFIGEIEKGLGLGKAQIDLPKIGEPKSVTGGIVRGVSQFLAGFMPGMKVAAPLKGLPVIRGAVAGGVADFSVFDPNEPRVSNLINNLAPELKNPITEYLEAKPEDTEAEGRLKNTIEGLGLGGIADGLFHVIRAMKGVKFAREQKGGIKPEVKPEAKIERVRGLKLEPSEIETSFNKLKDLSRRWDKIVEEQRRGVRPRAEARAEGKALGMTLDDVRAIAPGKAMNDAQAAALIDLIHGVATDTQASATKFLQTGTKEDLDDFLGKFLLLGEIDPARFGAKAEAGRSLGILNEPLSGINKFIDQFADVLSEAGDVSPERLARMIGELKTPLQMAKMATQATKPGASKMLMEIWINSLLSGPITHAVNFTSNMLTAFYAIPERALAARLHFGANPGVVKGEATQMLYGMVNGFMDALRLAGESLWTGKPQTAATKVEDYVTKAITGENLNLGGIVGRGVDLAGEFVRLPGRFLMAADEFWKVINYRMELHAEAFRKAVGEGLEGDALSKRVAEIIETPPSRIKSMAEDFANYQTFTKELGATGQAIQAFTASHPLAKLVLPFTRTPTNIFKYAFERTPGLNLLSQQYRADLMAGGVKRDLAMGKMAMGSMVFATVSTLAAAGYITGGGPQDKQLRQTMRDAGWQPYSIKVGDKYYSYNRFEPVGMLFGIASSFNEVAGQLEEAELEQLAVGMTLSFAESMISKTYVTGLSNVLEAMRTPDVSGVRAAKSLAGTVVPTGVAQYTKVTDPTLKEIHSIMDHVKSRIPGYSKDLPPKRNLWGEPIVLEGGLGPDIISPVFISTKKDDPVLDEIIRNRISLSMPPKSIGGTEVPAGVLGEEKLAHGIKLTPEEYDRFSVLAGNGLKIGGMGLRDRLNRLIQEPEYKRQSDGPEGGKAFLIKKYVMQYREAAKLQLRKEFPELDTLIREKSRERIEARMPQRR